MRRLLGWWQPPISMSDPSRQGLPVLASTISITLPKPKKKNTSALHFAIRGRYSIVIIRFCPKIGQHSQIREIVLSTSGWTLPIAFWPTAIEDDLAVHAGGRHSPGSSYLTISLGFSSHFYIFTSFQSFGNAALSLLSWRQQSVAEASSVGPRSGVRRHGVQVTFVSKWVCATFLLWGDGSNFFRTHLVLQRFNPALSLVGTKYVDFS